MVFDSILLVGNDGGEIDIFHAPENVFGYDRIFFFQSTDQFFDFSPLGRFFFLPGFPGQPFRKKAGAADEGQFIVVHPVDNISFPDQVEGADQLHAFKIGTVKLGHHGLDLGTVHHPHYDGLDDIIVMVTKGDLITSKLPGLAVEITPAHSGTKVAGRVHIFLSHHLKDLRGEGLNGHLQDPGIVADHLSIYLIVSGIHHQENHIKVLFTVPGQFLEKLGHQHGILAARDADSNPVPVPDQVIVVDGLCEFTPDRLAEFLDDAPLYLPALCYSFVSHVCFHFYLR